MPSRELTPSENAALVEHIRAMVAEKGTQSAVARELGVQQATLSTLLSGKTTGGFRLARAVARSLQMPLEVVLGHHADLRNASGLRAERTEALELTPSDPLVLQVQEIADEIFAALRRGADPAPEKLDELARLYIGLFPLTQLAYNVLTTEYQNKKRYASELAHAVRTEEGLRLKKAAALNIPPKGESDPPGVVGPEGPDEDEIPF
jgi:transcriptional regulator with XRE-family HTH domain